MEPLTVIQLKQAIQENTLDDRFIVLVCPENFFVADQYIDGICDSKKLVKNYVSSLASLKEYIDANSLIIPTDLNLNVLKVETFDEKQINYGAFENTIVVCKKVDKKIKQYVEPFIIEIPTLTDWNIKDYIKAECSTLDQGDIDWLFDQAHGNIYRIKSELDKLVLFDKAEQKAILNRLRGEADTDLFYVDMFVFSNALLTGDRQLLFDYLVHRKYANIDAWYLINLCKESLKKMLFAKYDCGHPIEEVVGITQKAAYGFQNRYPTWNLEKIKTKLTFLTSLDLKLKSGLLDMSNDNLLDYVICNLM